MFQRIKHYLTISTALLLLSAAGCKKGTFDINDVNPNTPSKVDPQFLLSSALTATAYSSFNTGGFAEFSNLFMGYWAFSGDYGGYATTATYNITNGSYTSNWDYVYSTILVNYQYIINNSRTIKQANFFGVAQIMEAFHYQRLVDLYNNIPYTDALKGGVLNYPKYTDAATVYAGIIKQVDSGIAAIKGATAESISIPSSYDVMFGGDMDLWVRFGNTVKLKILLNLTVKDEASVKAGLSGLTTDDFLGAGEDAAVNPGYSNSNAAQQNPTWGAVGFVPGGAETGNHQFYRANAYAVNFYKNHLDPRLNRFYDTTSDGTVRGRAFGSQDGSEHNTVISAIGKGILQSPAQDAYILPAFESLFMQSEAVQRGYITGTSADALYASAVEESFRLLKTGATDAASKTAADTYLTQADVAVNWTSAPNKLTLTLTQEWAALNMFDPITAWNNWKRLGIPATLPVSIYPGTTAPHIPIRLFYPQSEYTANTANVNAQGNVDVINGKIFWMP